MKLLHFENILIYEPDIIITAILSNNIETLNLREELLKVELSLEYDEHIMLAENTVDKYCTVKFLINELKNYQKAVDTDEVGLYIGRLKRYKDALLKNEVTHNI